VGGECWRARRRRRRRLGEMDRWLDGDPGSIDLGISSAGRGRAASRVPLLPLRNSPNGLPSNVQTQVSPKFPKAALTAAQAFLTGVGSPKIIPPPLAPLDLDEPGPRYDRRGRNVEYGAAREIGRTSDADASRLATPSNGSPDARTGLAGWVVHSTSSGAVWELLQRKRQSTKWLESVLAK